MAASAPRITDIKLLFARSGNRCAFPKCRAPMAFNDTLTGEVCHIKGARFGSARYDENQSEADRHGYENLILMCPTHHTVIDDDEDAYTVEYLLKLKNTHEQRSQPLSDEEASRVARSFVQTFNYTQSGGISATTVNANQITLQSAPPTNHLTHQRQIQAVEALWLTIGNLGREFGQVVFIDNVLTSSEIDAYFHRGENRHLMDNISEFANVNAPMSKLKAAGALDEAAKERPFVSHRLWSVFFVLKAVYARTALLLTNSYKERKHIDWRADEGCGQLLRAVLPAAVVEQARSREIGGLHFAIEQLEFQFWRKLE